MKTHKPKGLSFKKFVSILKDLPDLPNEYDIFDENLKSFEGLEDWIIKNVSEDRKADLKRLHQLKSNLLGWQTILIKLKGKPLHTAPDLEEKRQASIKRFEAMIEAALKDLDYRILLKQDLPNNENINRKTFESKITNEQFEKILSLILDIKLIEEPFGINDLKSIFDNTSSKTYNVKNNKHLAHMFNCLQPEFITTNWQSVIEDNKCFKGSRGKFLTASNLSASLQMVNKHHSISKQITSTINKIKQF